MTATIVVELIEDTPDTFDEFRKYTFATNIERKYERYLERFQPWRWEAKRSGNNESLAKSTESYFNRNDCLDTLTLLFAMSTSVELVTHDDGIEARRPLR